MMGVLLALGMVAVGCASDPGKQVREARYDEAEANAKQADRSAEEQRKQQEKSAEMTRRESEANADKLPPASENRADVQAKVAEERAVFDARASERLQKVDVGITEVKTKMKVAGGRTPSDLRSKLDTVVTARDSVSKQFVALKETSNDAWKPASEDLDRRLDELESMTENTRKAADKLK
jgi:hypothetical protein